jgi:hypothetical protein
MHTAEQTATHALRYASQDLDQAIEATRALHRRDKVVSSGRAREYLSHIRDCYDLRIKAEALGATGPLIDAKSDLWRPTPVKSQLVGHTAEQRKQIEWKGVFNRFPFWVYARRAGQIPTHYSIAAE